MNATAPIVKICGVRTPEIGRVAADAGAQFVGVVLAPGSPRFVTPDVARTVATALPAGTEAVALFQLRDLDTYLAAEWPHEWVQLHGDEDETLVADVARRHRIIRGIRFSADAVRRWNACPNVDVLLVDGSAGGGGTGFDHAQLVAMLPEVDKPLLLAGGLDATNVAEAIRAVRPWGVDVSSGVESAPGVKDVDRMRAFCTAVRATGDGA